MTSNALYNPLKTEQTDAIFFASAGHVTCEEIEKEINLPTAGMPLAQKRMAPCAYDRLRDTMLDNRTCRHTMVDH